MTITTSTVTPVRVGDRSLLVPGARLGAVALVAGAALNTAQAVLTRMVSAGDSSAARLADADRHPVAMLVAILGGAIGVALLLVGLQWVAGQLRDTAPRSARIGSVLTFVGTLGFLGVHALMLVTYAAAGLEDRAAAVAVLDHLDRSPVVLALVAPFLVGMFGGVLALTVGLFRTRSVPRWIPVVWALFLPIDFVAAGQAPVDPHWLFLAGAVGLALHGRSRRISPVPVAGTSSVAS
jgi:hypothetical protein